MGTLRAFTLIAAGLTLGALAEGCATQTQCGDAKCVSDEKTTAAVTSTLESHSELGAPGQIKVQTINHVVYLTGMVDTGLEQEIAESLAAGTPGVARVVSTLSVSR